MLRESRDCNLEFRAQVNLQRLARMRIYLVYPPFLQVQISDFLFMVILMLKFSHSKFYIIYFCS